MAPRGKAALQLVQEAALSGAGDAGSNAFEALYRRYWPRLVALCSRRIRDRALAEDIAQETLLRALVHIEELDDDRPVWPWLKTIATNLMIDHGRKNSRVVNCEAPEDRPAEDGMSVEEADLLRQAIRSLPGRQRAAVALRYINDWDANDAASFLGVTRPAYEQLLFRARRRLKTEYRRLASDVFGGVAAASASLRSILRRVGARAKQVAAAPVGDVMTLSASQLAGGALTLMVTLGAQPAMSLAAEPPRIMRPVAKVRSGGAAPIATTGRATHSPSHARSGLPPTVAVAASTDAPDGVHHTWKRDYPGMLTGKDVHQPEDTHVTSIAFSPRFPHDHTMFAAGRAFCPQSLCSSSLFVSTDAGATWEHLEARSFDGETVLLPPSFGIGDSRIFAMGRTGLQVSTDSGESFMPAAGANASYITGSVAISPAFNLGDPTILVGSQSLMRYRDDTKIVEPAPYTSLPGPLDPAYSPGFPTDNRIVVGGLGYDWQTRAFVSAVHTCTDTVNQACATALLDPVGLPASVRLTSNFAKSDVAYAFHASGVYVSRDGGASFQRLLYFSDYTFVQDLEVSRDGTLFLSTTGTHAGLFKSTDRGATWSPVPSPLFADGAGALTTSGRLVIAALPGTGFACSVDGGASWSSRCPSL